MPHSKSLSICSLTKLQISAIITNIAMIDIHLSTIKLGKNFKII